jgi:hypothetical protein
MSEVGNDKLKELAGALDELVEVGEDIFKDGIDMTDIAHLPRLASPVQKIYNCFKDIKALGDEAKDLDWNELAEVIKKFDN